MAYPIDYLHGFSINYLHIYRKIAAHSIARFTESLFFITFFIIFHFTVWQMNFSCIMWRDVQPPLVNTYNFTRE